MIRFDGVWKEYRSDLLRRRTAALKGISFSVERGEVFGYLGPNGAGKTTSMKLLLGLSKPTRGQVLLRGRPATDHRSRERVGFLPESPYFLGHLTGRELLLFFGRMAGLSGRALRDEVSRVLEQVGLTGAAGTLLRKYSKGMVQRAGLAQAILGDPELLVLDEPMSGLDPIGRREVRDLIVRLRGAGKTVFFSSHILQDAEALCDRVAIVSGGEIRSVGPLDGMLGRDESRLQLSVRGFDPAILEKLAVAHTLRTEGGRTLLEVDREEYIEMVIWTIRESGGTVESIVRRTETLEERFLREIRTEDGR
jgi:ABC-2 type transport system ATP-binding protein